MTLHPEPWTPERDLNADVFHVILDALFRLNVEVESSGYRPWLSYDSCDTDNNPAGIATEEGYVVALRRAIEWATHVMDMDNIDVAIEAGEWRP